MLDFLLEDEIFLQSLSRRLGSHFQLQIKKKNLLSQSEVQVTIDIAFLKNVLKSSVTNLKPFFLRKIVGKIAIRNPPHFSLPKI